MANTFWEVPGRGVLHMSVANTLFIGGWENSISVISQELKSLPKTTITNLYAYILHLSVQFNSIAWHITIDVLVRFSANEETLP